MITWWGDNSLIPTKDSQLEAQEWQLAFGTISKLPIAEEEGLRNHKMVPQLAHLVVNSPSECIQETHTLDHLIL
jgi:hypothetical protein